MALFQCRECAHHISDQAICCPSCGAPVTQTVQIKPRKRMLPRVLLTLMTLWTLGTLLWVLVPRSAFEQLVASAQSSLQRLHPGIEHVLTADGSPTTHPDRVPHPASGDQRPAVTERSAVTEQPAVTGRRAVTERPAAEQPPAPVLPVSTQPVPAPRSVYRTTAEQLYRDYEANVVAIETRIGASRVRLTGDVAEIDQDETGRPVVKIRTGKDRTAAMTLTEDQRAAAAQLSRGQPVQIECDKLGRTEGSFQGSGCTIALVALKPRERAVNLALYLADENGTTRVYVVGPLTEAACRQRSAEISSKLQGTQQGEQVVFRRCTDAVREKIPTEGCQLNTSSVSLAGLPKTHLWRYDCNSFEVAQTSHSGKTPTHSAASPTTLASMAESAAMPSSATSGAIADEGRDPDAAQPIPATVVNAVPAPRPPEHPPANNIRLASAGNSDTGVVPARIPTEESTVAHAAPAQPQAPSSAPAELRGTISTGAAVTANDDLARVKATDPRAAEHIATYCAQAPASTNRDALIAACRRTEADAWTRMVLQNEFPTMDEATRKKCSEAPFPDTYVAKESCARYVLHAN